MRLCSQQSTQLDVESSKRSIVLLKKKVSLIAYVVHQVFHFTLHHSIVPPSPKNVVVSRINSTSIEVRWDRQTLVELKGLAEYVIEYTEVVSQLGNRVTVPWTENNITISNLRPGVEYSVTMSTSTSAGTSGSYVCIT